MFKKIVPLLCYLVNSIYPNGWFKKCHLNKNYRRYLKIKKSWTKSAEDNIKQFRSSDMIKGLNKNSLCIDCGANVGDITSIMAESGAKVICFEPNPGAFAILNERFGNNPDITLYNKAVWDKDDILELYTHELNEYEPTFLSQGSSIFKDKDNVNNKIFFKVECINLIKFIADLNCDIDILKIDIEGAEYDILYEFILLGLSKKVKYILVETHDRHIPAIIEKGNKVRALIEEKNIKNIDLGWV